MAPSWRRSGESALCPGLPRIDERQPTSSGEANTGGAIAEVTSIDDVRSDGECDAFPPLIVRDQLFRATTLILALARSPHPQGQLRTAHWRDSRPQQTAPFQYRKADRAWSTRI